MKPNYTYLVLIGGASGSGKTTIMNKLIKLIKDWDNEGKFKREEHLEDYSVIRTDEYYKDFSKLPYEERKKLNFDHPNSIDFERLIKDTLTLVKDKQAIKAPVYDFITSARLKGKHRLIKPAQILFLEGIFALIDPVLLKYAKLKIFIMVDDDICFARRIQRDINERGRTLQSCSEQYFKYTKPMFEQFISPSRYNADLIIPNGGKNAVAIDILFNAFINKVLSENDQGVEIAEAIAAKH